MKQCPTLDIVSSLFIKILDPGYYPIGVRVMLPVVLLCRCLANPPN